MSRAMLAKAICTVSVSVMFSRLAILRSSSFVTPFQASLSRKRSSNAAGRVRANFLVEGRRSDSLMDWAIEKIYKT